MARDKGIVFTFVVLGESGDPPLLTQRRKALSAPGQQFMRVALVPHIPDNLICRAVKNPVERNCQLHRPQIGGQMSPCLRRCLNQRFSYLCTQRLQLFKRKIFQIFRRRDCVQYA